MLEAEVLRARLTGYTEDYDNDLITREQMLAGTARTRERLVAVEARMAPPPRSVLTSVPLGTPDVGAAWESYDVSRKAEIVAALMTVTILPGRRGRPAGSWRAGESYFDPGRVQIEWLVPDH
ncbi:hypothetical protein ADK86_23225 [Streptomyces sp. NRRL F-5755]|nr:hypothetical protein ADK86_23225 [Streptomyces sp. NRRL F-5755]